ncbi:MAG: SHOCT domain-containing protein [Oscillospiraceae bacterium]|nr:SHOCT domain-containing protein [Oscillospiraceae bacterium]
MREDTKRVLKEYDVSVLFHKRDVKAVEELLYTNEQVLLVLTTGFVIGYIGTVNLEESNTSILFLTDQRMILYYTTYDEGLTKIEQWSNIKTIKFLTSPLIVNHVQVSTEKIVYDFILPKQPDSAVKIYNAFLSAHNFYGNNTLQEPDSTEIFQKPNPKTDHDLDIPEQIEKLAELKDKGILSEEEFQTKKTELLSRL